MELGFIASCINAGAKKISLSFLGEEAFTCHKIEPISWGEALSFPDLKAPQCFGSLGINIVCRGCSKHISHFQW